MNRCLPFGKKFCLLLLTCGLLDQITTTTASAEQLGDSSLSQPLNPPKLAQVNIPEPITEPLQEIEITVIGTRTRRAIKDSPSKISVQERQDLDRNFVQDIDDLTRYEPGISVDNRPVRAGNGSINIRGIDGNRVLTQIDGIRLPDILNMTNTSRNLVDFECLKRVEILRGAASSLYGSDALGGVVNYTTRDPQDFLQGKPNAAEAKVSYNGASGTFSENIAIAANSRNNISTSICYTRRDGRETSNLGNIAANPQTILGNNIVAKAAYQATPQSQVLLTGELFDRRTLTTVNSAIGPLPGAPGQTVLRTGQNADDYSTRGRIGLTYKYDNPADGGVQKLRSNVYYQNSSTTEDSSELRRVTTNTSGAVSLRQRSPFNTFGQSVLGGDVQLESNLGGNDIRQRLVYGLDISATDTARNRDNTEFNLTTGTQSKTVGGEAFPNKTFPNTRTTRLGVYIQDEIELAGGRLSVIPSIRYDYYNLDPRANDPDFIRIGGNVQDVKPISASAISPKLGIVYKVSPEVSLTAQYARGFRSPPYDDAAIAFTNFAQNYTVIPNANLQPETSDGFEIGIKTETPSFRGSLVGFYNRYDNFIDTIQIGTAAINGQTLNQFQARNIRGAEISGVEAKAEYRFNPQPGGLSLIASAAFAQGTSLDTNQPLDSVNPFKAVMGLRYRDNSNKWGSELVTTLVAANDQISVPANFKAPSYGTVDLLGYYNFSPDTTLNVGLFNIFNTKYFQASDVRGLSASNRNLDLYTQPGFNVKPAPTTPEQGTAQTRCKSVA